MCKRKTDDPLLKTFLQTYGLNLLSIPRENASPGDFYVVANNSIAPPGKINNVLTEPIVLPEVKTGEVLANISGTITRNISFNAGISFFEGFMGALGAAGLALKVRAGFEKKGTSFLRFQLAKALRDSMDHLELGSTLINKKLNTKHPSISKDNKYFISTAVVRTSSLTLSAFNQQEATVDLDLKALDLGEVKGNVTVDNSKEGMLTFEGTKALAIGLELQELIYNLKTFTFSMKVADQLIRVRNMGKEIDERPRSFIGDPINGDAFITLP